MIEAALKEKSNKEKKKIDKNSAKKDSGNECVSKKYYLGEMYDEVYLSQREADCMFYLLNGKTNVAAADQLDLSPRTVEFYVSNMKKKLNCTNKFELIEKVTASAFDYTQSH